MILFTTFKVGINDFGYCSFSSSMITVQYAVELANNYEKSSEYPIVVKFDARSSHVLKLRIAYLKIFLMTSHIKRRNFSSAVSSFTRKKNEIKNG